MLYISNVIRNIFMSEMGFEQASTLMKKMSGATEHVPRRRDETSASTTEVHHLLTCGTCTQEGAVTVEIYVAGVTHQNSSTKHIFCKMYA